MARRWYNEDFRKLYTRQDGPWLALSFAARGLADHLLRYADDRGTVAMIVENEEPGDAVCIVVRAKPSEREMVVGATLALIKDGYLVKQRDRLVIRNFVAAQERLSQEAARQRRKRDRDASGAVTEDPGEGKQRRDVERDSTVTNGVTEGVTSTANVTPNVTPMFAVSRRDETSKEPSSRVMRTQARGSSYGPADLESDWWRLLKSSPGDAASLSEVLALLGKAAAARDVDVKALVGAVLPKVAEVFASMRQRKVHTGAVTAGVLARKPDSDPGRYLVEALALLDDKPSSPAAIADDAEYAETVRRAGERERLDEAVRARAVPSPFRAKPPEVA